MLIRNFYTSLIVLLSFSVYAADYQVRKVASGLNVPWGMTFVADNKILFTEKAGRAGVLNTESGNIVYLTGLPKVMAQGQGGLLDTAIVPDYTQGDWIYFTYSKRVEDQGVTMLARAHLNGNILQDWHDLISTQSGTDASVHYGSRIAFDDSDHVYFSIGDRGIRANAQNLSSHAGSILRLKRDGSIPLDNPFIGDDNNLPEIWSYGHRNPQGLVWDNNNKRLWSIEHGPRGGDEINLIKKGKNYGWPIISYGKEYWGEISVGEGTSKAGMEQPIKVYIPSIAPGSLLYYTGDAFPQWQGNLLAGALKLRHLNRVQLDNQNKVVGEERLLKELNQRIRALVQSPEGWVYFSTDSGNIYVIKPK